MCSPSSAPGRTDPTWSNSDSGRASNVLYCRDTGLTRESLSEKRLRSSRLLDTHLKLGECIGDLARVVRVSRVGDQRAEIWNRENAH